MTFVHIDQKNNIAAKNYTTEYFNYVQIDKGMI